MKAKFLLFVSLLLTVNLSGQNACPDIESLTIVRSTTVECSTFVRVVVTNDISAPKGLRVQVFQGTDSTGTPLVDNCFQVPGDSTASFDTDNFACMGVITVITTRFTASNGLCQGGSCSRKRTISGTPGVVLPVRITSFNANRNGGMVSVKWTSESETNFSAYQVEMNDGSGFRSVGTVMAINNGLVNSYSFEKSFSSKGSVQFRLKLLDKDGGFAYSKTALVKGDNQSFDFNIYPNPSTSANTNILISGLSNTGRIQIIDMAGKVLKTLVVNSNNVKVGYLPNGVYMVKVSNTATLEQITKRLVIVN